MAQMDRLVQEYTGKWNEHSCATEHDYRFFASYSFSCGTYLVTVDRLEISLPARLALEPTQCGTEACKTVRCSPTWPVVCRADNPKVHMLEHENGINASESQGEDDGACSAIFCYASFVVMLIIAVGFGRLLLVPRYCNSAGGIFRSTFAARVSRPCYSLGS